MKERQIIDKKIAVIGLGDSGFSAALLAKKKKARVFVSEIINNKQTRQRAKILERKGVFVELGAHTDAFFQKADFFVVSPGLKPDAYPLLWAKKNGIEVYSEIEFASWFCPAPIIAITGSNGKTTTTSLLGEIFKKAGKKAVVCGNIGNPFSNEYNKFKDADVIVLEVSSFQLEHIKYFRPKVSIVLNITQNHFDHHKSMKEYIKAKSNIFLNQRRSDVSILNISDPIVLRFKDKTKTKIHFFARLKKDFIAKEKKLHNGCWMEENDIYLKHGNKAKKLFNKNELKIKGIHNVENTMAAFLSAKAMGLPEGIILKALKEFHGLEHRCEEIGEKRGVVFINDSKSTTVDATAKALSIFSGKTVFLICGGRDKGSNFELIAPRVKRKVKLLIAIGEAREKIAKALSAHTQVRKVRDLKKAVMLAYKKAKKKETILLSPICASFDMFNNFEHRGCIFKQIVSRIKE